MHYRNYKLIKSLLIFSPLWTGILAMPFVPEGDGIDLSGGVLFVATIIGIPIIAGVGLLVKVLSKKSPNTERRAIIGYAIPAVIICSLEIAGILAE